MPYMGNTTRKASDIRRFDVTGSTSATHTLTWTAPNEQSLIVTVNGVKQHEDAYSVSGTTLTLTSALVSADKLEVIGINDIGTTITPAQNSVDTDKIADDAVTSAKIADGTIVNADVNASAAIALSKLATDPSNASNLATGTVPTARLGTGTASSSTFLRGDQSWAEAGGGKVLQVKSVITQDSVSGTTVLDWESTTQFTQSNGTELFTLSITPSSATNRLVLQALFNGSNDSGAAQAIALFQDSGDCIAASAWRSSSTYPPANLVLFHEMAAGTTSSTTFKIRFGPQSSTTMYANRRNGAAWWGGKSICTFHIWEIEE